MAQYYQIVGQGHQLTLEDIQRFCPNICLDSIIVNQDDQQQYGQQQVVVQQAEPAPSDIIVSEGVQPQLVVSDGLQYQQQYIIRHDPSQPPRDFQQQQQQQQQQQHQQQQQQQALHRQVYYTSDLPVDAQVVLQQAQQIIDASLMQQSSSQRPQHLVSGPAHVLSQPTVIHPAQQPPPQPPPLAPTSQHAPQPTQQQQPQQQLQRAPQLIQHLQQQHQQQIHLQQLQQQQQLQHQIQQQQQQQQQHQQHMQPQQIQHQQVVMHAAYINQQGTPTRAPAPRLLNQALNSGVTLVRGPTVRTVRPRRPAARAPHPHQPPRMLNTMQPGQSSPSVSGAVGAVGAAGGAAVRGGVPRVLNPQAQHAQHRPPRPRTPLHHPMQVAQGQSASPVPAGAVRGGVPRILNAQAAHSPQQQLRPPRPRTPLHHPMQVVQQQQQQQHQQQQQQMQQQHQQHQLTQHVISPQLHQQQLNQLKLTTQLLNQQQNQQQAQATRIITPQGTIVTQNIQSQMPQHTLVQANQSNGPLPQNTLTSIPQRSSPHPQQVQQVKKVAVQPNNATSDMDDLEESITAAILTKHSVNENMSQSPQQYHTPPPPLRPTQPVPQPHPGHPPLSFNSYQQQPMAYDPSHMQHPQGITQMLMEPDSTEEDRQVLTLTNGQRITLAEYKRTIQMPQRTTVQQQQARETGRQTLVRSKEQQRPVQRVPPMQTQQQTPQHENNEMSGPSEQASEPQSAKMLIFLQNGEQRLITFTLPKESCTLQEVLEQVNVPFSEDTHIQCMQNTSSEIDYFVSVGSTTRIEEMLENHPMLVGDISSRNSPSVMSQPQSSEMSTPEKSQCPDNGNNSPESPGPRSPPPRLIDGMLALCKPCGYTGYDFSRCERCKRIFTEEPKGIPSKKVEQKKKEPEKTILEKQNACGETIKLNLLKTTMKTLNNKATTPIQDKKPPRVRKPRGKQPDPEPVILTLSSDEEDSNSSMMGTQHEQSISMKEPSLSEIEGGTPDSGIGIDNMDDTSREEIVSQHSVQVTSLSCRTIRIGSYRYTPKEKVYISAKGIKIVAPSLTNDSREVALQIQLKEVVRILVHFGKGLPVIFLYTMSKCGVYIRKALDMTEESGPYYNPMSKNDPFKRITLLPEVISEDAKMTLKVLFGKVMDELNAREANDILVRTCPKESNNVTRMATRLSSASIASGTKSSNPAEIRQILIYPPGKGGIPINTEDYMCLAQDQFLNDVIIDFYLKHLVHDVLTPSQREKTHIFSTFFYKRLTTKPSKVNKSSNPHEWDSSLTPAQKRHARVKTWTKNVNIFQKDYIVVPINENCHWFVAIICFPSLEGCRSLLDDRIVTPQAIKKRERRSSMQIGSTTITPLTKQEQLTLNCDSDNLSERDEAEAEESDLDMQCDSDEEELEKPPVEKKIEVPIVKKSEPIKQPCILIFDSLAGASRSRVVATLRDYLTCEYQAKVSPNKIFNKDNIKGSCPKIPQQNNFTDCGLYLLQYVEQFFKDPVLDYSLPIKQLSNWFDEIVVTRKREEISILLKKLMHKYNPDSHLALPDITFPTLNGKLIETEEQDDGSDGDKGNSSKLKSEGKESETPTLTFVKQMPTGDIVVKRNFADSSDTIHLHRKTIRLSSDAENRSMVQIKQDFIKKGDSENQILIPIKLQTSDLVKDIQNSLISNKNNKTLGDKKHGVHNQNVANLNCIRQSVSDSDSSYLKSRRVNKLDDSMNETSKKFKKNEC